MNINEISTEGLVDLLGMRNQELKTITKEVNTLKEVLRARLLKVKKLNQSIIGKYYESVLTEQTRTTLDSDLIKRVVLQNDSAEIAAHSKTTTFTQLKTYPKAHVENS